MEAKVSDLTFVLFEFHFVAGKKQFEPFLHSHKYNTTTCIYFVPISSVISITTVALIHVMFHARGISYIC